MNKMQKFGIFAFAVISAIVLYADVYLVCRISYQLYSECYYPVSGEILHCQATKDGSHWKLDLLYTYTVDGRPFEGTQYSSYTILDWRFPYVAGAYPLPLSPEQEKTLPATIYYDPFDPSQAVLKKGLDGSLIVGAMFMLPITLASCMPWVALSRSRRFIRRWKDHPTDTDEGCPLPVLRRKDGIVAVRLTPLRAPLVACAMMALSSLAITLVVIGGDAIWVESESISPLAMSFGWAVSAAVGWYSYRATKKEEAHGRFDLRIYRDKDRVVVPFTDYTGLGHPENYDGSNGKKRTHKAIIGRCLTFLRLWTDERPVWMEISAIKEIDCEWSEFKSGHIVRLNTNDDRYWWSSEQATGFDFKEEAEAYAAWLRRELAVNEPNQQGQQPGKLRPHNIQNGVCTQCGCSESAIKDFEWEGCGGWNIGKKDGAEHSDYG